MIDCSEFRLDIHTHTVASGHAYGTIREMAQAAAEKKLDLLGISEHAPGIPGTCEPIYFSNLRVAPRNRIKGLNWKRIIMEVGRKPKSKAKIQRSDNTQTSLLP